MKKIHIIIAAIAAGTAMAHAESYTAMGDTVINVSDKSQITITESAKGIKMEIAGDDNGETMTYKREFKDDAIVKTTQSWSVVKHPKCCRADSAININITAGGLYFGLLGSHDSAEGMDIEMGKSFEVGMLNLLAWEKKLPWKGSWSSTLSIGMGVNWRVYAMTRGPRFYANEAGEVNIGVFPEGTTPKKSRLNTFSLQFPILWHQRFPGRIFGASPQLTVGAVLNWNTYSGVTSTWETAEGADVKEHYSGLHQRRMTVDMIAGARICGGVNLYFRYSPMKVFNQQNGPTVAPLSVGVMLGM